LLMQYIEEDVMDKLDLIGKVQLMLFHLRFVFDRRGTNGINNHMNPSPYPIFHVLREDKVLAAMDKLDSIASRVWRKNANLLGRMEGQYGREGVAQAMEGGGGGRGGHPQRGWKSC
jgi:hypothetical protein